MPSANFSRAVLSNAERLAVLPVAGSGWCDWGSPQRVLASLAGTESHGRLLARIGPRTAFAPASNSGSVAQLDTSVS